MPEFLDLKRIPADPEIKETLDNLEDHCLASVCTNERVYSYLIHLTPDRRSTCAIEICKNVSTITPAKIRLQYGTAQVALLVTDKDVLLDFLSNMLLDQKGKYQGAYDTFCRLGNHEEDMKDLQKCLNHNVVNPWIELNRDENSFVRELLQSSVRPEYYPFYKNTASRLDLPLSLTASEDSYDFQFTVPEFKLIALLTSFSKVYNFTDFERFHFAERFFRRLIND